MNIFRCYNGIDVVFLTNRRWVFEKYDGIRGFWNPVKQAMYSRGGNKFDLPKEVLADMPQDLFLDGELWYAFPPHVLLSSLLIPTITHMTGSGEIISKNR